MDTARERELTLRLHDEEVRRLEAARGRRQAEVLAQIARSINAAIGLPTILQTVAEAARELCASDLSAIALREDSTGEVVFRYRAGERHHEGSGRLVVVPGRGAGGQVLASGRPFRSDDLVADPRVKDDLPYIAVVKEEKISSVLVVPIAISGSVEGLLYVDNRSLRPFTDRDEAVLSQLADHAAVAIASARLLAREQQARAEAEHANRIKDEFLATVSHELRTPINAVLGWAVMLRSGAVDAATTTRALEIIERNARVQSKLIEDLLDVSRVVTGRLRLDVRVMEPVTVVESALDAVRPTADAKGVRVQAVLDPTAGPISGDPERLQQVLWNLLSNAIKFTPRGGRVHVRLERVSSHIEIVVSDTGRGIAPEALAQVFDRFRRHEPGAPRGNRGLGLGLALARALVEQHGGSIVAESDGLDRGATFRVRLPLLARLEEPHDRPHPTAGRFATAAAPDALAGVRVLVVDDQPDARELFAGILTGSGAEVRRAATAAEALAGVTEWAPDVLVSDVQMPGEDGYALIGQLRAFPGPVRATPAVAVTAFGTVADRIRLLSSGFDMHVAKPVEPAELVTVVATLVGRTQRQR